MIPHTPAHRVPAYVGLDLETTGLDPSRDHILELGLIIFDANLIPIAYRSWITSDTTSTRDDSLDPEVLGMHLASGLLGELHTTPGDHLATAVEEALEFLDAHHAQGLPMLGSSVTFDRMFLLQHAPDLLDAFHHRSLDATSVRLARMAADGVDVTEREPYVTQAGYVRRGLADRLRVDEPLVPHRVIFDILSSAALAIVALWDIDSPEAGL